MGAFLVRKLDDSMVKAGRKGKYEKWLTNEGLLRVQGWARDGLTDEQIAENMQIGDRTFYEWKVRFPQIAQVLKESKDVADWQVENALHKAACGWEYDETTKEPGKDGKLVITKVVHKVVQPNPTAQIFWLKNRKRDKWRDKQETEITGKDGGPINVCNMSDEDADKRIAELESKQKH
jgi:hypothetical protein